MQNPELNLSELTPKTIYMYDNHTNVPWNMTFYKHMQDSFDQKEIVKQRMYASQKKGVKVNDNYITKRGFYMDYSLKIAKSIPSSVEYINPK